jgi:hypothetical protein
MTARLLLILSISTALSAQQQEPRDLLDRVRAKVVDSLKRLPRYMCTETIDRFQFDGSEPVQPGDCERNGNRANHLVSSDRLRLDVAVGTDAEMFSWTGALQFDDHDLRDIVQEGAISTGSFTSFLTAIFGSDSAQFTYNGEKTVDRRTLAEFGFQVAKDRSRYYFGEGKHPAIVGYSGTFLADPKTAELVRLELSTNRLSSNSGACYATTSLNYQQVRFNDSDFLLPSQAILTIMQASGGMARNRTLFSSCHAFLGESTISFGAPNDTAAEAKRTSVAAAEIPADIRFQVVSAQGLDTATWAAGDEIKSKLSTPIRKGVKILVPEGAPVVARVVRLRELYGLTTSVSLEFRLETVEIGGAAVRLRATPDSPANDEVAARSAWFTFPRVNLPYLIGSGLVSKWVTATAPK